MVTPQWGGFQKPQPQESDNLLQEYQKEIPGKLSDEELPESEKPQWGNFLTPITHQNAPSKEEEGWGSYLVRNFISNASRVAEQAIGKFGNIERLGRDILKNYPQTGGLVGWGISKLIGPEKWNEWMEDQILPTSEDIKKFSQEKTGGYTKPKNKAEERFQGFIEDVGATLTPGPRIPIRNPIAQRAINSLLIPAAANVTKNIVEDLGFGDDKANLAKIAVWMPLSLAANVNAPYYASQLMNNGRNGMPQNLQANIPRFTNRLDQLERSPLMLSSDPRTALARQILNGIRIDIAQGSTNARSLMNMYDGVNAAKRSRGLFELSRGDQAFARRSINSVLDVVRYEIRDIGRNHPEALSSWEDGLRAWATIHRSQAISNWVQSLAKGLYSKILSGPAATLFGVGTYVASKIPLVSGTSAAVIPTSYKTSQVLYRMWNDPTLSRYYWNAILDAERQNVPAFISNYEKLNKKLEKSISNSTVKSNNKKAKN